MSVRERDNRRPKGYLRSWTPKQHVADLIGQVQDVLAEYRQHLPLTARQIFYRLVGQYDYDKTEQAYARLCEALVKARRSEQISFGAIRDDGTVEHGAGGFDTPGEWWQSELYAAKAYTRDRGAGQDVRVELWCEAAGMAPQLARVARPYGVPVYSTGGFSSVTVTYEIAQRVLQHHSLPTVFMHVGDFDPSGESIFDAMAQDVGAFVADELGCDFNPADPEDGLRAQDLFRPDRLALTSAQVQQYRLPTAPPKKTDTRSRSWVGQTCQLEAMQPDQLAGLVTRAIEAEYDTEAYRAVIAAEKRERAQIVADVERILEDRKR